MTGGGRVVVVGSVNADLVVTADRLPAPGETVPGSGIDVRPGGKGANQAVAAARAGAAASLVAAVGDDDHGRTLLGFLASSGVDVHQVRADPGMPTGTAVVTVDPEGANAIVVVPGANAAHTGASVAAALGELGLRPGDVVVTGLEIPVDAAAGALRTGRAAGAITVLNPSPVVAGAVDAVALADVVVANDLEVAALGLLPLSGAAAVVRTLGDRGAEVHTADRVHAVPARRADVVDTTGAGDCFLGVLAAGLAAGDPLVDAARRAAVAAGLQVERPGAGPAMPDRAQIDAAHTIHEEDQ